MNIARLQWNKVMQAHEIGESPPTVRTTDVRVRWAISLNRPRVEPTPVTAVRRDRDFDHKEGLGAAHLAEQPGPQVPTVDGHTALTSGLVAELGRHQSQPAGARGWRLPYAVDGKGVAP